MKNRNKKATLAKHSSKIYRSRQKKPSELEKPRWANALNTSGKVIMRKYTMSQKVDFGKAIRAAQASSHTRISDIAKEIGVAPQQVSRWQKSEDIKLSRAVEIAAVFDLSLADFLDLYHE